MTLTSRRRLRLCAATAITLLAALAPVTATSASTTDTTAPKITATSYKQWLVPGDMKWRGAFWSATPAYTWSSSDNVGVASHEVQTWIGNGKGSRLGVSTWSSIAKYVKTYSGTRRSLHIEVGEGEQACQRVRAKDAAGNHSPWSAWRCTYAPFGERTVDGAWDPTSFSFKLRNTGAANDRVATTPVRATGVRIRVATGPTRHREGLHRLDLPRGSLRCGEEVRNQVRHVPQAFHAVRVDPSPHHVDIIQVLPPHRPLGDPADLGPVHRHDRISGHPGRDGLWKPAGASHVLG